MFHSFKFDAWTGTHLFGSFFLVKVLLHITPDVYLAAGIAFLIGVAWELIVDWYFGQIMGCVWADRRGVDIVDLCANLIGIILAVAI